MNEPGLATGRLLHRSRRLSPERRADHLQPVSGEAQALLRFGREAADVPACAGRFSTRTDGTSAAIEEPRPGFVNCSVQPGLALA